MLYLNSVDNTRRYVQTYRSHKKLNLSEYCHLDFVTSEDKDKRLKADGRYVGVHLCVGVDRGPRGAHNGLNLLPYCMPFVWP